MSRSIDERIVEMRFDNKQFEDNVQTSLSSLDKLKQSLDMSGAAKGLESVGESAKRCDMSGLSSAVETVRVKFSALEVMAVTALTNITNSAINAGKQMLRSLTVEPISQGFGEYELKMGSIQTIMASTGENLETVNKYLDELNRYADKTIYSFSDMTSNIGKFTNAGVKLEDAVKAIQGVSNEAAVSGANANEASRAMYNFAQALSAGYVKLIDWKSIENANMATVEFKNQLIDTAVALGTVVKVGGKYQSTTTDMNGKVSELFDATSMFNDSLSAQWMTTDVLVQTLGNYSTDIRDMTAAEKEAYEEKLRSIGYTEEQIKSIEELGKKAFDSAQDVKTFTQLMDTLKEAAGSGWATTWEIIFGDFEEAKKLWTDVSNVVGGFINAQSEARNALLQGWKDLGGRNKVIEAARNAFQGLISVVTPVKEAFRDIFPKTTAEQLYAITEHLSEFASHLKLSDEASANLKNTFKGLFAVLDIVKQAFYAVFNVVSPLFGHVDTLGSGILRLTGSWGEWLVKLDETIKKGDVFNKTIQRIIDFLKSVPGKIDAVFKSISGKSLSDVFDEISEKASSFLSKIKEVFAGFRQIDTKGISALAEKTSSAFAPLTALFDGVKKVASGAWELLKKLSPVIAALATAIGSTLGRIGSIVGNALKNADFEKLLDLVNGGVLTAIGIGIKRFVDNLSGITKNASGFVESLSGILDGVKGSLEAWQKDIQANTLLKIAGAIGILTVSLVVLSSIDPKTLYDSLSAITVLFGDLAGTMMAMSKMGSVSAKNSVALIAMSAAVLILAAALKNLSSLNLKELGTGIAGLAGISLVLVTSAKLLSGNSKHLISGAVGLVIFAAAIRLLVKPVKELGDLDIPTLTKGLVGVGLLCVELAAFLRMAKFDKLGITKGLGLLMLAEALNILATVTDKLAALDIDSMIKGLVGIGALLAEIAAFMKLTNNSKGLMSTAVGMTVLGAAMLIFNKAIAGLGALSWEEIAKGLVGMGGALLEVAAAMNLMPSGAKVLAASVGMVALGAAMLIFSSAISSLSGMTWSELAKGLTAMGLALAEVVIAMNLMNNGAIAGAAAVLVCAAALGLFVPILKVLGGMSLGEIATGLAAIAGVFVILGVAGYALKPVALTIIELSGAMALIGVAAVAFGAGLLAVSIALSAFGASAEVLVNAIITILRGLILAIPDLAKDLAVSLGAALPAIIDNLVLILKSALLALNDVVPLAVEVLLNVVQEILASFASHIQGITESLLQIIVGVIDGLAAGTPQIIASAVTLFKNIFQAIFDSLGGFDVETILSATAALTAFAGMMTLITVIAAEAAVSTALLPLIGRNLSLFIECARPFLAEIQNVDPATLQGAKYLAETVLILTASTIMDSLTSWFTGGNSLAKFGAELAEFAPYLVTYSNSIKGIDAGLVESSANAAKALAEMATGLPNSGGVVSWFTGDNSLAAFAKELAEFGPSLKAYSDSVNGLDADVVTNSANAAMAIAELALKLPNSGGVVSWFTGDNSLASFAEELSEFGPSLKAYAVSVDGLDPDVVVNSANAAMALAELALNLPNSGGVVSWFTGDNSLAAFADELAEFGPSLKSYALSVNGLKADVVINSVNAAKAIAELAHYLPNSGGVASWFAGDNTLSDFGEELAVFGPLLKMYSDSVNGLKADVVINSAHAAKALAEMARNLPNSGGVASWFAGDNTLSDFAEELAAFGPALMAYAISVDGLKSDVVINSTNAAKALFAMAENLPNSGGAVSWFVGDNSLADFAEELSEFGPALKSYAESVDGLKAGVVINSANAAKALFEMAENLPEQGGFVSWFTGEASLSDFAEELSTFGPALMAYSVSVDGLKADVVINSANAAKALFEMADNLPDQNKLTSWFCGKQSLSDFADELAEFGPSLKAYEVSVDGLKADVVINSANAAKALFEMADNLPDQDDKLTSWFGGKRSLSSFAKELSAFGPALMAYSISVDGLKSGVVIDSANAAKVLFEMADNLPDQDDKLTSWFGGKQSLSSFAKELSEFGPALMVYAASIDGLKAGVVINSANAAKALAEMANILSAQGGLKQWFTGKQSLSDFAKDLTEFGPLLKEYADSVTGLKSDAIINSANAAKALTELANGLDIKSGLFSNDTTMKDFGKMLSSFGSYFKKYYDEITGIKTETLQKSIEEANNLVALAKNMASVDSDKFGDFGKALTKVGKDGVSGFCKSFSSASSDVKNAASSMITTFTSGLTGKSNDISKTSVTIITVILQAFNGKKADFKSSAQSLLTEFAAGMDSKRTAATTSAIKTADTIVTALRNSRNDFSSAGKYAMQGFIDGMSSKSSAAQSEAKSIGKAAAAAMEKELKIKSPSKRFYEIGDYTGMGFVNALSDYTTKAYNASDEIAESAQDGLPAALGKVVRIVNGLDDVEPVIRPVLDLSDIESGANSINGLLSTNRAYALAGRASEYFAQGSASNQNSINVDNGDVVQELTALRRDVTSLSSAVRNMKIVLDSGTVVGALAGPMDSALGQKAAYKGRGN